MKYQIQEGFFHLPDGGVDESVNIIKFSDIHSALVVTRTRLKEGQTLDNYCDQQMAEIKRAMKNFLSDERQVVVLPGSHGTQRLSYQTHCEFDQKQQRMYQRLLFTEAEGYLLVMAYSQPRQFTETDTAHWQNIIDSLVLH
ncbi:DcrB-related protein [Trabulsiella odontotermitis]|uniref:DcrB-related protein n=1 Tax=Trabulsiella odontotermitis TaxID=379893 RepID=UPI003AD23A82